MISVLPIKDNKRVEELFLMHNLNYTKYSGAVEAKEAEKILGYCFFCMDENGISIEKIEPTGDIFLADGILRSALHVAVCNNLHTAFYNEGAPVELLKKLNFILNEQERTLNINKLFESCCSCNNKNT